MLGTVNGTISRLGYNCISGQGHCWIIHMTGYKAVRQRSSGGPCVFLEMDKQACKSIICHADNNITDEISPLALSFHFAEAFVEYLIRDL